MKRHVSIPLWVKLFLTTMLVQFTMLGLLAFTSVHEAQQRLQENAELRLQELRVPLESALSTALFERDIAGVQELLNSMYKEKSLRYLVVTDMQGRRLAAAGLDNRKLPEQNHSFADVDRDGIFNTAMPVTLGGEQYGTLHFGISNDFLRHAEARMKYKMLAIVGVALVLSFVLLIVISLWLTRHLRQLAEASQTIAAGNLNIHLPVTSHDEVGQLNQAFNAMAASLRGRIEALQQAESIQRRYLAETRVEKARLLALLSAMNLGILFVSINNRVAYTNPAFTQIWMIRNSDNLVGREIADLLNDSGCILARPDHFSRHIMGVMSTHESSESLEIEMTDGRVITQLSYPVREQDGRIIGRILIFEDVTRERQTAEQLIYLAERDSLTGLYNRRRFEDELWRMVGDITRHGNSGSLLFFDLDEFKYINDTFGHRAGDSMLIRVAGAVGALIRSNEIFCRLGGDEFAILMPDASDEDAQSLAERIVRAVAQIPFRFEGKNLRLTCSLGIAAYPQHAESAEQLVAHADAAMYQAKEAGKNAWRSYRADLDTSREMIQRMSWNERIGRALDEDRFVLHFQGIYHTQSGILAHLEVLLRMHDETNPEQLIMPGHFIPLAEKSGQILQIDRWVIKQSIALLQAKPDIPALAVNISGRSLDDPGLALFISEALLAAQVTPRRLMIEITETSALSDLQEAQRFIQALRHTGCIICLDDFGTGFASFAYLKHIKADILKIDGLFIRDIIFERDNKVFVKAIVDVARGLGKTTVAEFVESHEIYMVLKEMGVDMVQGYHLDIPSGGHWQTKLGKPA
ncbi:MAG: EAL domain-containing protein [Pseudomonadota bacterium]